MTFETRDVALAQYETQALKRLTYDENTNVEGDLRVD